MTEIAQAFNEAINRRDIDALTALMTDDHTFIDTAGHTFRGKEGARTIWQQFFDAYPDYQNHFTALIPNGNVIVITGHSTYSEKSLEGPGLWTATIDRDKISEWRVYEDTQENRKTLGISS